VLGWVGVDFRRAGRFRYQGSLSGAYKTATNLPKQFANLQQIHVNTDMTDTLHEEGVGEGAGVATFHLWRMPPISDWQQLPGWEVFINLLPFFWYFAGRGEENCAIFTCLPGLPGGQPKQRLSGVRNMFPNRKIIKSHSAVLPKILKF